jgi:DNA invertase Pin-like site-specific DNA recombinase|tara:strand:- start:768 stop:968 length:201 start_codon:yes stop_codon:yes gene_type:complete
MPNVSENNLDANPTGKQLWVLEKAVKDGSLNAKIIITIEDEKGSRSLNRSEASELISKLKNGNNDA